MIERGRSDRLGASWDGEGVNFALYSENAESVQLCLFDRIGSESSRFDLPGFSDGVWHGYLPGCMPGQRYGYRARGRYAAQEGFRFNHHKLLLDPYARELVGRFHWRPEVFDYKRGPSIPNPADGLEPDARDSAPYIPKAIVQGESSVPATRHRVHWNETIIYELNVRGFTMRFPGLAAGKRGTFRGMHDKNVLAYIKSLGVTAVELLPIHAFLDEEFLVARGARNFWGYNSYGFFAPDNRFLGSGGISEFRQMVNAIHDSNLEVILDVVYNHTAESGRLGPTLSFRGIDNTTYYRLEADDSSAYVNDTGTGNTLNIDHPQVRRLVLDSLRYWSREMGVDGFRFDLASILGRTGEGFDSDHPFFVELRQDAELQSCKLIAEPWDVGPGGYQLGRFPVEWAEWNDRCRDALRQFWRGDQGTAPELGRRMHGSADLFEHNGRRPQASINMVSSHDGFTLADLVSYSERHNQANGEDNRDGHAHNYSCNHGVEGPTDDLRIRSRRRRHRLNLLASLIFSQGTPMLLAGDEFGNTQAGNNNAYAQDNEIGWLDWTRLDDDHEFVDQVRAMIQVRQENRLLRQSVYRHGEPNELLGRHDVEWFGPTGAPIAEHEWPDAKALGLLLVDMEIDGPPRGTLRTDGVLAVCLLLNAADRSQEFVLPALDIPGSWLSRFSSAGEGELRLEPGLAALSEWSLACLVYRANAKVTI